MKRNLIFKFDSKNHTCKYTGVNSKILENQFKLSFFQELKTKNINFIEDSKVSFLNKIKNFFLRPIKFNIKWGIYNFEKTIELTLPNSYNNKEKIIVTNIANIFNKTMLLPCLVNISNNKHIKHINVNINILDNKQKMVFYKVNTHFLIKRISGIILKLK